MIDTEEAHLVWRTGSLPTYAFPGADVALDSEDERALAGFVRVPWDRVDAWYEEEERVFVHPRDPFHRVDTFLTSRRVRVEGLDGARVARAEANLVNTSWYPVAVPQESTVGEVAGRVEQRDHLRNLVGHDEGMHLTRHLERVAPIDRGPVMLEVVPATAQDQGVNGPGVTMTGEDARSAHACRTVVRRHRHRQRRPLDSTVSSDSLLCQLSGVSTITPPALFMLTLCDRSAGRCPGGWCHPRRSRGSCAP
ncbi:MAG TPA: hypothetical protein VNL12_05980 [Iamia sp.]|nr:hypothetical protein [Iamia sp.]HXH56834.1 hypothetical protein [Iamia sp.]